MYYDAAPSGGAGGEHSNPQCTWRHLAPQINRKLLIKFFLLLSTLTPTPRSFHAYVRCRKNKIDVLDENNTTHIKREYYNENDIIITDLRV